MAPVLSLAPVRYRFLLAAVALLWANMLPARAAEAFALKDGDRVVLIGNTLIEREQNSGYWETGLTRRFPHTSVTFRNLGWSGDTVWGDARAGFDTAADGFRRLKEHVLSLKPTVLLVGYGGNEAFHGSAGLPAFVSGLNTLLDALAPAKARLVLLSPLGQEAVARPLPDPAGHNKDLRLYADAIREVATKRGALFVDLLELIPDGTKTSPPAPLTENGIHLTPLGYWKSAPALEQGLGLPEEAWRVRTRADGRGLRADGAQVELLDKAPLRFRVTDDMLPEPPPPDNVWRSSMAERVLSVRGLPAGDYLLTIDGKAMTAASAKEWGSGVVLTRTPEFEQAEKLRQAIVAKNLLYFHRWRPQNDTYLFGFRRHEQGKNAAEIPQFDPLVAKKEAEIAHLRVPVTHTYELKVKE
jgi:lysophospholipase L1-like esterase